MALCHADFFISYLLHFGTNTNLDADDGIEYSACLHELTPDEVLELKEQFIHLWNALNSLPETQGRRVDAHFILGMTYREIAKAEGVDKSVVRGSGLIGIAKMKKYLQKTCDCCILIPRFSGDNFSESQ